MIKHDTGYFKCKRKSRHCCEDILRLKVSLFVGVRYSHGTTLIVYNAKPTGCNAKYPPTL